MKKWKWVVVAIGLLTAVITIVTVVRPKTRAVYIIENSVIQSLYATSEFIKIEHTSGTVILEKHGRDWREVRQNIAELGRSVQCGLESGEPYYCEDKLSSIGFIPMNMALGGKVWGWSYAPPYLALFVEGYAGFGRGKLSLVVSKQPVEQNYDIIKRIRLSLEDDQIKCLRIAIAPSFVVYSNCHSVFVENL